jgi:hypothetical protein
MPCLTCKRIYSFPVGGGGAHGKAAGTAPVTMTEAGLITEVYLLFTEMFLPAGEIITELISGKGNLGNTSGYLKEMCNAIGRVGKKTSIGKSKTIGVCRDCRQNNINQGW